MDAIIIPGAAVWPDGPSPALLRRTLHAARLWHAGWAPVLIPCGGLGKHPPTEAAVMAGLLIAEGVPPERILLEARSSTTLENFRYARQLLTGRDVVIVTDSYHAARARMVALHFGFRPTMESPRAPGLQIRQHLREALARPAYAMRLRREPPGT